MDEDNGELYKCTAASEGKYVWEKLESGSGVQSDWAENDPKSPAYVKNRFGGYEEASFVEFIPKKDVQFALQNGLYAGMYPTSEKIVPEMDLEVSWDGKNYSCVSGPGLNTDMKATIGNFHILNPSAPDTGEPFMILVLGQGLMIANASADPMHNIGISKKAPVPVKIDPKYLPAPLGSLSPITPELESAFLQAVGGKAVWSKLVVRSDKAPDEWTYGEWEKYYAAYEAGISIECAWKSGKEIGRCVSFNFADRDLLIICENVGYFYKNGSLYDQFAFSEKEVKYNTILAIEDGTSNGSMKRMKIKSSSPSSTKEFYITVDDTGTISATEVES